GASPARSTADIYGVLPADHRLPYEIEEVIFRIFDRDDYFEFQPEHAPEMLCSNAKLNGRAVALIANRRGFIKTRGGHRIGGIIRAGAEMVETMATTTVPKIILTINHASGAGYYAMAGQGFDPNFTFSWPTARIGVMEGDSAVQALYSVELQKWKASGQPLPE